jgi:hypothetical protein
VQEFVKEESKNGWPYLRPARGRAYFDMRAYLEWKQGQPVLAVGDVAAAAVAAS